MLIPHPVGLPRLKARSNQCAVRPARRPPSGTIPSGASRTLPRILGNWFRKGGIALDQYVFAAATRSALPGVKGDRNSRISPYPLELLPYPDRAVEHHQRARGSITKGEVRQRRQDNATRGG